MKFSFLILFFILFIHQPWLIQHAYSQELVTPNPFKEKIIRTNFAIELTEFVQIPESLDRFPKTRINYLHYANDNTDHIFVCDMLGKIYLINNGKVSAKPFLDIGKYRWPDFYTKGWESGVASFAFHPDFSKLGKKGYGKFYTIHSGPADKIYSNPNVRIFIITDAPIDHYNVISEWSIDKNNPDQIDPDSYRELMRFVQPYDDHDVGHIAFNPGVQEEDSDYGMLYISVGDGGDDQHNNPPNPEPLKQAQTKQSPFGKILRINPLQAGEVAYTVPEDNPFISNQDYIPEIWALGFRNPQRFSWDPNQNGYMYIADIGENNIEEINIGKPGKNYGWSKYEGVFKINQNNKYELSKRKNNEAHLYTDPIAMFDHDEGNAVTGGYVYRGDAIFELYGKYIFGDIVAGTLFVIDTDSMKIDHQSQIKRLQIFYGGKKSTMQEIINSPRVNLRIGMDRNGNLYALTKHEGQIFKINPVNNIQNTFGFWHLFKDKLNTGSKIAFNNSSFQDNSFISVTMKKGSDILMSDTAAYYSYVGLGLDLDPKTISRNVSCNHTIELTYKLSEPVELILSQYNKPPSMEYRINMVQTDQFITKQYNLTDFKLPEWSSDTNVLDCHQINAVKFQISNSLENDAKLSIKSLRFIPLKEGLN